MKNKKNLLILLLTIPASSLLIAEDDIATTTNNEGAVNISQVIPQQDVSLNNKPQETEILLEQRFICEQEGQEGGVVCQMYECLNEDCHAATAIKTNDDQTMAPAKESAVEEAPSFDFNESEIICPVVEPQKELMPEEEMAEFDIKTTAPSELDIMSDIDVPSAKNEEIQQLKSEIKNAEKMCERAESDPREKAICEGASAKVQWLKKELAR